MKVSRNYLPINHIAYMGTEYPKGGGGRYSWGIRPSGGGAIFLGYSSPGGGIAVPF